MGMQLNAEVAAEVMGWSHAQFEPLYRDWYDEDGYHRSLPNFSELVEEAWWVMIKLEEMGFVTSISVSNKFYSPPKKRVQIEVRPYKGNFCEAVAEADDLAEAICLAAVAAVRLHGRSPCA